MSSKHTPGPWKLIDGFVAGHKEDHLGQPVADCVCYVSGVSDDHDANLSLIMSAPELLEALESVADSIECYSAQNKPRDEWDEYDEMMYPRWINALAAIKKARGENGTE